MLNKISKNPQAMIGLCVIALTIFVALAAPILSPNDPGRIAIDKKFLPPSDQYPLGTDNMGRCVLSRLIYGARYSLGIAIPTLLVTGGIGLILGTVAAYVGGWIEKAFLIICDIFFAFPSQIIVMSLVGALGQSITVIIVSVIISMWAWYAKVIRTYASIEKSKDYVMASRINGCSGFRIVMRHIVPNILPQCIVFFSTGVASYILMLSGFSYLGLGFSPDTPEWGAILNQAKANFYAHPMLVIYPGGCILIVAVGFNLFGEALRDLISPEEASE